MEDLNPMKCKLSRIGDLQGVVMFLSITCLLCLLAIIRLCSLMLSFSIKMAVSWTLLCFTVA